eukprot:scaffold10488_cov67-Cyclotella_meneghiniana.AAC.2
MMAAMTTRMFRREPSAIIVNHDGDNDNKNGPTSITSTKPTEISADRDEKVDNEELSILSMSGNDVYGDLQLCGSEGHDDTSSKLMKCVEMLEGGIAQKNTDVAHKGGYEDYGDKTTGFGHHDGTNDDSDSSHDHSFTYKPSTVHPSTLDNTILDGSIALNCGGSRDLPTLPPYVLAALAIKPHSAAATAAVSNYSKVDPLVDIIRHDNDKGTTNSITSTKPIVIRADDLSCGQDTKINDDELTTFSCTGDRKDEALPQSRTNLGDFLLLRALPRSQTNMAEFQLLLASP